MQNTKQGLLTGLLFLAASFGAGFVVARASSAHVVDNDNPSVGPDHAEPSKQGVSSVKTATTPSDSSEGLDTIKLQNMAQVGHLPVLADQDLPYVYLSELSTAEQLKVVDGLPNGNRLQDDEVAGLTVLMKNKALDALVRNNIANRLVERRPANPALAKLFCTMYEDQSEDPVWRGYCIQFLAVTIESPSPSVPTAKKNLLAIAKEDVSRFGTTALLHICRLADGDHMERPANLADLIASRLKSEHTDEVSKGTLFSLAAKEQLKTIAPYIRDQLDNPTSTEAQIGALAGIGALGDARDLPRVERCINGKNRALVKLAQAIKKRMLDNKSD